jgi:hypothetical protein
MILAGFYFVFKYLDLYYQGTVQMLGEAQAFMSLIMNLVVGVLVFFILFMYLRLSIKGPMEVRRKSTLVLLGLFMLFSSYLLTYILENTFDSEIIAIFGFPFSVLSLPLLISGFKSFELETESAPIDSTTLNLMEKLGLDITKPEALTQEDIKFYKEQTMCLVCKSDLKGFTANFICPNCKTLYCEKCANALSRLENECWSCDQPIDISRPTKKKIQKDKVEVASKVKGK